MHFAQRASILFVAAGLTATVAASATADEPAAVSGADTTLTTGTLPPSDVTLPGGTGPTPAAAAPSTASTTSTTPPTLPTPEEVPPDNGPEPQVYHGRIQIPVIELDAPYIEGIRISTLDYGPGHWPGTAMPGELGNVVVAGHRTSHNADFRNVDQLQAGDEVIFDLDDSQGVEDDRATVPTPDTYTGRYVYEVVSVEIVPPDALWIVNQEYRHTATLFACHPPGSVSERIVVHLDLVDETGEPVDPPRPATTTTTAVATG